MKSYMLKVKYESNVGNAYRDWHIPRHYLLSLYLFPFVILLVYLKKKISLHTQPSLFHILPSLLGTYTLGVLYFSFVSLLHSHLFMPSIDTKARSGMNGTSQELNYTCLSYTTDYIIKGRVPSGSEILLRCTRFFQVRPESLIAGIRS